MKMKKVCFNCETENLDFALYCQNCGNELKESIKTPIEKHGNRNWRIINSLWIILTFTLGFLNWIAFLYVGLHVRQRMWILSGIIYAIPLTLLILFANTPIYTAWLGSVIVVLIFITGVISIIQAFKIRNEYLIRLEAKKEIDIANQENLKRKLKNENRTSTPKTEKAINTVERKRKSTEMLETENKAEISKKKPVEIVDKSLKESDNRILCDNCSARNSGNAKFCTKCGLKLDQLSKELNFV